VVVIIWYLDLQQPVQSVLITTLVASSNPVHDEVYLIQLYVDLQLPVQSVPITTNIVSMNPTHGEEYLIQHYMIKNKMIQNCMQYLDFFGFL
jgi:hypothetical protein